MTYNREMDISTAGSRFNKSWRQQRITVSDFMLKLAAPVRGTETLAEYMRTPKQKQDAMKDVGGYVFGALRDGRRGVRTVVNREAVTIDMDTIPAGHTNEALERILELGYCHAAHSTRKHTPGAPRLRVIIFLDRAVTPEEYEAITYKLAEDIDITWCDPTTFEPSRLMYWPSVCSDGEYVYQHEHRLPLAPADAILARYPDWRDLSTRPGAPREARTRPGRGGLATDPKTKRGVVGAFCRAYSVPDAIDKFLSDAYEPAAGAANRYTFLGGSTAGGAVLYDGGQFLFSHHATDPAGGRLCNAFDLVRLHLYGDMDINADPATPVNRLPSYTRMVKLVKDDDAAAPLLAAESNARM